MRADKACDIVMEGGAASGIIYPRAICELARRYRFQRIGGTSAGAVAAAAAAAAEYGRRRAERPGQGNPSSFETLQKVPDRFQERVRGETRLKWLFEPEAEMRPAYELFMALISKPGFKATLLSLVWAAARYFPASFFGGAVLGLLIAAPAAYGAIQIGGWAGALLWIAAAGGILATAVFAVLLVLASLAKDVVLRLPRHHFGVARGYSKTPEQDPSPRVTTWMYELVQDLAGKPVNQPLTFGDLEGCPDDVIGNDKGIVLRLMTTCVTHGRPYRMPFADDEVFYYDADELAHFFPPEVIGWMKENPNPHAQKFERFYALPLARNFPVVVAARMSMAFPFFFSSIPLYALDRTRHPDMPDRARALAGAQLERCWFADGGICSNLPVHFFDRALPRWPTFALDLRKVHRDLTKKDRREEDKVWIDHDFLDNTGRSIITEWWTVLEHEAPQVDSELGLRDSFHRAKGFLDAVLDTMMNWHDNAQLRPVGSRDRVAHVGLEDTEGDFNLCMDPAQIHELAKRGAHGGRKLRDYFARGTGWRDNRSARLFSLLTVSGEFFQCVKLACDKPVANDKSYVEELQDQGFCPVGCRLTVPQSQIARALLSRMLETAAIVPDDEKPGSLAAIVPPPRQTIRVLPEGEPTPPRDSLYDSQPASSGIAASAIESDRALRAG
jgi:predicted acylesterase/phospholipase RssA